MFSVIHLLTGETSAPPILYSMSELYTATRKADLEDLMWCGHYLEKAHTLELIRTYETLPEKSKLHFLLSPATCEIAFEFQRKPTAEGLRAIVALARDEASFGDGVPPKDLREATSEIWSPMGDERLLRCGNSWHRKDQPKLDSAIVIDFESPYARVIRPTNPLMSRPPEQFTEPERQRVVAKFSTALRHINDVAPTFGRLIKTYTRAMRVRKCEGITGFKSESVADCIGEIRVLNVHRDNYSMDMAVEALLHESVHNFLSTYEYLRQRFVLSHNDKQGRPVSPWTGNSVPTQAFCHAVFVWFALFNLTLHESREPEISSEQMIDIQRRRNRYASGFMIPTPISECLRNFGLFAEPLLPVLDVIQNVVRRSAEFPTGSTH